MTFVNLRAMSDMCLCLSISTLLRQTVMLHITYSTSCANIILCICFLYQFLFLAMIVT